jgi:hypothetical protein
MSEYRRAREVLSKVGFLIDTLDPEDLPTKGMQAKRRALLQKQWLMNAGTGLPAGGKIEDVNALQKGSV